MPQVPGRKLNPDDIIYRKLEPGTWNASTGEVFEDAFIDNYKSQSFNLSVRCAPSELLDKFAKLKPKRILHNDPELTAEKLYFEHGYGVAAIRVGDLLARGFIIELDDAGNEFNIKNGHINIIGVRDKPDLACAVARVLSGGEIFPKE